MANREPTTFGTLLLRLRAAAGLTQEQLAARAGLSADAIAALERGKRHTPRAATVALLATALGLDADACAQLVAAARRPGSTEDSRHAPDGRQRAWWVAGEATPLVGRVHELDTIVRMLVVEGVRLLTLTGPAGVGKTRLALAAASRITEDAQGSGRFPDGVTVVDLAPVRDPPLVLNSLANALGLLDMGGQHLLDRLV